MRIMNIFILVFLMSAFAIGINMKDSEMSEVNSILDNATTIATNFSLTNVSNNSYIEGGFRVGEKFVHFAMVAMVEVMRVGILFGHDNPKYFDSMFILRIAQMIIWVALLSLLFVPLMYFAAFLIIFVIWIYGKVKKRKRKRKNE